MAVLKCKMCGGDLILEEGISVCVCEYCGSKQTVPSVDDEKKRKLYERANKLRFACDFDKAASVYESIIDEYPDEAEAFWGLVLCEYGIEYVDDPATGKKIPTCHRSSFESVMKDVNFEQVMEYSDSISRAVYREEAKTIEEIRKGILAVSEQEAPYDIFICYKEADENGNRTIDSVMAQEVYEALTEKGYRVFFSRISLEDKLGMEYEPYIFAALNSAKIMLAFGTDYEYYNAVWVKNEWSRFLKLMAKDKQKRLIPCYKNLDAYDIPEQFQHLQAQDMGKVGAIQDLLRGIDKMLGNNSVGNNSTSDSFIKSEDEGKLESALKRGWMAIEDEEWNKANSFFETALNYNAECASAYLGKTCANFKVSHPEEIGRFDYNNSKDYQKFERFANESEKEIIKGIEEEKEKEKEKEEKEKEKEKERLRKIQERKNYLQPRIRSFYENFRNENKVIITCAGNIYGIRQDGTVVATGNNEYGQCNVSDWTDIVLIEVGCDHIVGIKEDGTVVATGNNEYGQCNVSGWTDIVSIVVNYNYTFGIKEDGTVVATGNNKHVRCNVVSGWTDIVSIVGNSAYAFGIKEDGTVVATGDNEYGQCNVSGWTDIVSIVVSNDYIVGLKADGTVVGNRTNMFVRRNVVSGWTDIVSIVGDGDTIVGIKADGTVVAIGDNEYIISHWTDIVSIVFGNHYTVGLKADGTVVATGDYKYGQCDVSDWTDIVSIGAGNHYTVGLKADGTVVATGDSNHYISGWTDIVSIEVYYDYTVGLKADGTVVVTNGGYRNDNYNYNVSDFKLFDNLDAFLENWREIVRKREALIKKERQRIIQKKKQQLISEKSTLQVELEKMNRLFSGKRKKEIEKRLHEIQGELLQLDKRILLIEKLG